MPDYAGMTLNERLAVAGLIQAFDKAVIARDRAGAIAVLRQVELSDEQAAWTTDTIFANPARYGY
jgi:hypothetical protein